VQRIPSLSISRIVTIIKRITALQIFIDHPEILWGGNFWRRGYYAHTVGSFGTEEVIQKYVQAQGRVYKKNYSQQLSLFNDEP
jgi:putative transposase